ncbi:MAG: DEAD/DEAH box helicase [Firmicutes bacterium]|nr:DEAD/DEAH box helicase [Bacillota bacterium]
MDKKQPAKLHYKYKGLVLDEFQREALWHIQNNTSVLVSAPTGTGKTLIADYLIHSCLKEKMSVIYTAPIKALVNQKFVEFFRQFGKKNVGMATGDVSLNLQAPILIVTTEIFRNMALRQDPRIASLNWVIFDELHYLNHEKRGTVWEESILLKPNRVRVLGISATVPNIHEIADWIYTIHQEPIAVVEHQERAVPLRHLYFNKACQAIPRDKLLATYAQTVFSDDDSYDFKAGSLTTEDIQFPTEAVYQDSTRFMDLIRYVRKERLFPCLYFSFSRRGCSEKAALLSARYNFLSDKEQQGVLVNVRKRLRELNIRREEIPNFDEYLEQWTKGIGVHHAGLLPIVKQIVETLLEQRLIRVLFTTETFAVGINMPVRTVCFDSLIKFDGQTFRHLTQQEYFQMAGRAGRRGMDKVGTVLSLVDFTNLAKQPIPEWNENKLEPIVSQFELSFNLTLNLIAQAAQLDLNQLFAHTLAGFQNPAQLEVIMNNFLEQKAILTKLGFVEDDQLTNKGRLGSQIYVQELLLSELLDNHYLNTLDSKQLAALAASLIHDYTVNLPAVPAPKWLSDIQAVADRLNRVGNLPPEQQINLNPAAANLVAQWVSDLKLDTLLKAYPIEPGDFIQLCRRAIDVLRQIQVLAMPKLGDTISTAISKIDRGLVKVRF